MLLQRFLKLNLFVLVAFNWTAARAMYTAPSGQVPANNSSNIVTSPRCEFSSDYTKDNWKFEISTDSTFATGVTVEEERYFRAYFKGLAYNTKYFWRGRSYKGKDSSHWSTVSSFTTTDTTTFYSPNSGATAVGRLYMSCHRSSLSEYEFILDTSDNFNSSLKRRFEVSDTSFDDFWVETYYDSLYFGVKYYFKVRAYSATDTAKWSEVRYVNSSTSYLSMSVANSSYPTIQLRWSNRTGIIKYQVQLDSDTLFNSPDLIDTFKSSEVLNRDFEIRDINYDTRYYWRIRAINPVDTFEWSERKTFTTGGMYYSYISMGSGSNTSISYFQTLYSLGGHIQVDTSEDFSTVLFDTLIVRDTSQKSVYTSVIPYKNLIYGQRYYVRARMYHSKDSADWVQKPVNITPIGQLRYPYPDDIFEPGDSVVFDTSSYSGNYFRLQIDTTSDYSSPGLFDTIVLSSSPLTKNIRPKVYYNKTYYWRLKIANEKDTSEWSDYKYARTFKTPEKPELSYPYNGTTLYTVISPSLRWVALDKANYRLQMDTAADFSSPAFSDTLITDFNGEFKVENLYFRSRYHWRVRYETDDDYSQWSEPRYFNTADRVLNLEPRDGAVEAYPNDIDWRSIDGTIGYIIKIDTIRDLNSDYVHIDTVYEDKAFFYSFYLGGVELLFDQNYYCQVSLFNNVDTLLSDTNYFITRSREAPIQVSPLNGAEDQSFSVTLRWNSYTNAKGYLIEISEYADMRDSFTVYQTALSYKTNLDFGKDYYWRVRGMYDNLIVVSDYSETWKLTVQDAILGPILKTPLNEEKEVTLDTKLRWEKVPSATNYTVELSNSPDFIGLYRRTSVTNSYLYDVLTYNAKYFWRVRATVSGTSSKWSETRSFTTAPKTSSVVNENDLEIVAYPNPVKDYVIIELNNNAYVKDIIDLVGNVVYTVNASEKGNHRRLDLSSLKSGVYVLRIESQGVIYTKRIIKE